MLKKPKRKINIKKYFATAGLAVILATVAFNFVPTRVGVPAVPVARATGCDVSKFSNGKVEFSKDQFSWGEGFKSYARIDVPDSGTLRDDCLAVIQSTGLTIQMKIYGDDYNGSGSSCSLAVIPGPTSPEAEQSPKAIMENGKLVAFETDHDEASFSAWYSAFYGKLTGLDPLDFTKPSAFVGDCLDQQHPIRIHYRIINQNGSDDSKDIGDVTTVLLGRDGPASNPEKTISRAGNSSSSNGTPWDANAVPFTIKGLRTIYRAVYNEDLTIPYSIDWADPKHPNFGESIDKPGQPLNNIYIGIKWQNSTSITCDQFECGNIRINDIRKRHTSVPDSALTDADGARLKASIFTEAVKSVDPASTPSGKPMGTNGFTMFPIFGVGNYLNGIPLRNSPANFSVEIYASDASRTAACEAQNKDKPDPKAFCADPKNQVQAGQEQNVTSTADAGAAGGAAAGSCNSGALLCFLSDVILWIVKTINALLYFLFYYIIAPVISAMLSIHTFSDTFVQVIYPGWEIMRNICNIFFILALLVIALATVFGVKGYQYKSLLLNLLIAALFVNFSLVIGQAVLGLTETVQSQFLNPGIVRQLGKSLMYDPIFQTFPPTVDIVTATGRLIRPILYLFLAFGSFVVMAMIAYALFLRMIALWIYYMISPLAWAAGALPMTAKYRSQWWSGFLNNALFVPALAFFLNIAALLAQKQSSILETITASSFKTSTSPVLTGIIFQVAGTLVIIIFLKQALAACKAFSASGSAAILKVADRGFTNPFSLTKDAYNKTKNGLQKFGNGARIAAKPLTVPLGFAKRKALDERQWYQNLAKGGAGAKTLFAIGSPVQATKAWRAKRAENAKMKRERRQAGVDASRERFGSDVSEAQTEQAMKVKRFALRLRNGATGKGWTDKQTADEIKEIDKFADVLTEEERQKLMDDRMALAKQIADAGRIAGKNDTFIADTSQGAELQTDLLDAAKSLNTDIGNLLIERSKAAAAGNTKRVTDITKEIAEKTSARDAFNRFESTNRSKFGASDVDFSSLALDPTVGKYFKEDVFDAKATADDYRTSIKNMEKERDEIVTKESKDDTERTTAAGLSAFVTATAAGPGYKGYGKTEKDNQQKRRDVLEKAASDLKTKESVYQRKARTEAEATSLKNYPEEALDEKDFVLNEIQQSIKKGDKHKASALVQHAAKKGWAPDLIKRGVDGKPKKYKVDREGMQTYMQDVFGDEMKVGEHVQNQIMTQMAKGAEANNQYMLSKATRVTKAGTVEANTDPKQKKAILGKLRSKNTRERIRTLNENTYAREVEDKVTGGYKYELSDTGHELLKDYKTPSDITQIKQNMPVGVARALAKADGFEDLNDSTNKDLYNPKVYKAIRERAGLA